ncbi:hypothetical protein GCM10009836_34730 [Pseudonocardia ailaonensis]|uniref:ABC transporter domain-containing protein n=1 Tax=Pseudonocardia ailaonensis TaxID=367279 RepID=A0ABN2N746_9PSEU
MKGLLTCEALTKRYSGVTALNDVAATLRPGEVTALVGANGAGKTTFLDMLSGTVGPTAGTIVLDGRDITAASAWQRAELGMLRGFQDGELFPELTVRETLRVATFRTRRYSLAEALLRVGRRRRHDRASNAAIDDVAGRFGLTRWLETEIGELSLGMAKVVQLAAVAVASPSWVLLDEPAAGLARAEVDQLARRLRASADAAPEVGYLIVEHDASLVSIAADRVIVMAEGAVADDFRRGDDGFRDLLQRRTHAATGHSSATPRPEVTERPSEPSGEVAAAPAGVDARGIRVTYGKFEAVHGIDIRIEPATLSVLVGTNGAGKSSVLNAIVGIRPPSAGSVTLDGADVSRRPASELARRGLVLVPSGRGLMAELTVAETLRLTRPRTRHPDTPDPLELFPELGRRLGQRAGTMSGGEQQMVALARSIQLDPRYLLIDELSLGLSTAVVDRLVAALLELRDRGVGLLVVEQNAPLALGYSDHAFVMNGGRMAFDGPSAIASTRTDLFRPVFLDPDSDDDTP